MANLLSGLEGLGLGNLENLTLFEKKEEKKEESKVTVIQEEDLLFDKTYTCPVCDNEFKSKMVRAGKTRCLPPDLDLRPRYDSIDIVKYDLIACPICGYAALTKYFPYVTTMQKKEIREKIQSNYIPKDPSKEENFYTYETALERYKLALVNAIIKHAKNSERAYLCLKTAWLYRGKAELLSTQNQPEQQKLIEEAKNLEIQFLNNAYTGFKDARAKETLPICGMDEYTLDYLISVLALKFDEYDVVKRLLSNILVSKNAGSRIKDKARSLKDLMVEQIENSKQTSEK